MISVTVQKNLIGLEDLLTGTGTVEQSRGPSGTDPVTITKINGANLPYDDTYSMQQKFDALQADIDSLPAVVDQNGDLLTGLINTSTSSLDLTGRIWRKEVDANTREIYYGTELMFSYDPINGNLIIPGNTDYITADTVLETNLTALITALDTAVTAVKDLSVGTAADNLVQLDSSGRLPAIDGSLLTNLNVDTGTAVPIGAIFYVPYSTVDAGYLEANGQAVSRTTYSDLYAKIGDTYGEGDGTTTFNVPDLRGEFIRGWDNARDVDTGRVLGSFQGDEFKSHTHTATSSTNRQGLTTGSAGSGVDNVSNNNFVVGTISVSTTINSTGSTETRPRNIALMPIIKAIA